MRGFAGAMIRTTILAFTVLAAAPAFAHEHAKNKDGAASAGTVAFRNGCSPAVQPALQNAVAGLHSFDWVAPAFLEITKREPGCAAAWWGAAMSVRGNPLGGSLDAEAFKSGRSYLDQARKRKASGQERAFIDALDVYYRNYKGGHAERTRAYEQAMRNVYEAGTDDPEAATFYALAILEAVDLNDKAYTRQIKAGAILEPMLTAHPDHPGVPHYLIHAYDYAPLAGRAVEAARRYAAALPGSPHARHMPSHIFTILGLWPESITANENTARALDASAPNLDIVDSHGFDFIAYARLQLGQDKKVGDGLAAYRTKNETNTLGEARYALERGDWRAATAITVSKDSPLDQATARFARSYGAARNGNAETAAAEWRALTALRPAVVKSDGEYWAALVDIYARTAQAWIEKARGNTAQARSIMADAAARDDSREKHIYLENKLLPMREVYAELLLETGDAAQALKEFERSLAASPNRFRSFAGAARAAAAGGDSAKTRDWSTKLVTLAESADTERPELAAARATLAK